MKTKRSKTWKPTKILDPVNFESELISFRWQKRSKLCCSCGCGNRSQTYEKISGHFIRTKPTVGFLPNVHRTEPRTLKSLCQCKILEEMHRVLVTRHFTYKNFASKTTPKVDLIRVHQIKSRRNQRWCYSKQRLVQP